MNHSINGKHLGLAVSCVLALGVASSAAYAQSGTNKSGYLIDSRGEVAKSGSGLCWRTSSWTPALALAECDPDLMAKQALAVKPSQPAAQSPAAAPPAAAPVAVVKPAGQRVTLAADALFDFNKADLRPAGRASLDEFLAKLKGITPEVIIAVGHADRFGAETYNHRLSEQRAAAVKTYLRSKGVEANRVHTEGKGEKQPVTKAEDCKGGKSPKTIACLQPDRRVEVEVLGTQIAK